MTDERSLRAARARTMMRGLSTGVLATMSLELPGYPFGSITPFAMSHEGRPLLLVSDIAQHTKNMHACAHVSLIAAEEGDGNAQARGRVTVLADARRADDDAQPALLARYQAFFPESKAYGSAHGFAIFALEPKRIRFIGGFGDIYWVETEDWLSESPGWLDGESHAIEHMNDDHHDALVAMARKFLGREDPETRLVALDAEGCHLRAGGRLGRIPFANPALEMDALRGELVALARASR